MSVTNVFRDVAIRMSTKQPQMVDQILEEAPILEMLPMQAATHGLWNVYEEISDVTGAGLVDADDELPVVNADSELKQVDLSILGGRMEVGEDKARKMGGPAAYFAGKQPAILRKTGMDSETSIIYNNLRAFAEANHTASEPKLFSGAGSANANYSIVIVKWVPGEVTGLFDPAGFGRGMLMDIAPVNGGGLYLSTVESKSILVYGVRLKSYIGIQLANARYVSSVVNIDLDSALPAGFDSLIDDAITAARGTAGNTFMYMHPRVKTALYQYKAARLQTVVETENFRRTFQAWNDIPMVTSYNFLAGTELNVTVA